MSVINTTELPLIAKLMRDPNCKMLGNRQVVIRNRPLVEFKFEIQDQTVIEEFQTGADGLASYEHCRRLVIRMISDLQKDRRTPETKEV